MAGLLGDGPVGGVGAGSGVRALRCGADRNQPGSGLCRGRCVQVGSTCQRPRPGASGPVPFAGNKFGIQRARGRQDVVETRADLRDHRPSAGDADRRRIPPRPGAVLGGGHRQTRQSPEDVVHPTVRARCGDVPPRAGTETITRARRGQLDRSQRSAGTRSPPPHRSWQPRCAATSINSPSACGHRR